MSGIKRAAEPTPLKAFRHALIGNGPLANAYMQLTSGVEPLARGSHNE
jgi:hypothetical protein